MFVNQFMTVHAQHSNAYVGRINVTRGTDCNLYLLPTIGLNWQKLLDFERDYEREVMNATTTHKLWMRIVFWKYQRTVCIHLSLRQQ